MNYFLGNDDNKEENEIITISQETKRLQIQMIRDYSSSSVNMHLAISNSMTLNQIKNEALKNIFKFSKDLNNGEQFKKPKSKLWFFSRAHSETNMSQNLQEYDDDLSD